MHTTKVQERRHDLDVLAKDLKMLHLNCKEAVLDGIVQPAMFDAGRVRLLWVLKEANDKDGGGWDLRKDLLAQPDIVCKNPRTWLPVAEVSYGILSDRDFPYDELQTCGLSERLYDVLREIAVININKKPGGSRATPRELRVAYGEFRDLIWRQIEHIRPDIAIAGGTFGFLRDQLKVTDGQIDRKDKQVYSCQRDGVLWLDAYHPAQRTISHKEYYTGILSKVRRHLEGR